MPEASRSLAEDHALLCDAVRAAGEEVKRRFEAGGQEGWSKADGSPVSEADMAANRILKAHLITSKTSDYGWLSEETKDTADRLDASRVFVVDPIDGTRAFLEGTAQFAVCGALIEGEAPVAAAVFNPITDEFYEARAGLGAKLNGETLSVSEAMGVDACRMLASRRMFGHPDWPRAWPEMHVSYRCSTHYRMTLVADGRYDATIALWPKPDWDVAAGALIASEAGATVADHLGRPYKFNQPLPVQPGLVCAAPGVYPEIVSRLAHLPSDLREIVKTPAP